MAPKPVSPHCASYQARKVRAGRPRAGPARVLGERRVFIRANVSQGPSRPSSAASMRSILSTPASFSRAAPAKPHIPAPTNSTFATVLPSRYFGETQGFPGNSKSRKSLWSCASSCARPCGFASMMAGPFTTAPNETNTEKHCRSFVDYAGHCLMTCRCFCGWPVLREYTKTPR